MKKATLGIFILIILIFITFFFLKKEDVLEDEIVLKEELEIILIDPVPGTEYLVEQEKYADADEYLSFFMEFDYVKEDSDAVELLKEIQEKRKSWRYKLSKISEGILKGSSDEIEGDVAATLSDVFAIGDVRDLIKEGYNYATGTEVDKVVAALSGIGLGITAVSLLNNGDTQVKYAKPGVAFLKGVARAKLLPKWLIEEIITNKNLPDEFFKKLNELNEASGIRATSKLLSSSNNANDFKRLANFGMTYGKDTNMLLKTGGQSVIEAFEKHGKSPILKEAVQMGEDGVKNYIKLGPDSFKTQYINKVRRSTNKELELLNSGLKARINNMIVYQRNQTFAIDKKDAKGRTNLELMKQGLAPIDNDGRSVNLHHYKQRNNGPLIELTYREHNENDKILHRYITPHSGKKSEIEDRNEFNKFRINYWKQRAKDFEDKEL